MTEVNANLDGVGDSSTGADGVGSAGGSKENKVDFATYDKTVREVKALKDKLSKFEESERAAKEKKDLEEKNFLGVIEEQRREVERLQQENESHKRDKTDFRKLNAAVGLLTEKGIQLESKYIGLLPIDQIIVDENGSPDRTSVAKVVSDFQKEHPRLIAPASKLLPNDRPANGIQKMTVEEMQKLPRSDQVKAIKEGRVQYDFGGR